MLAAAAVYVVCCVSCVLCILSDAAVLGMVGTDLIGKQPCLVGYPSFQQCLIDMAAVVSCALDTALCGISVQCQQHARQHMILNPLGHDTVSNKYTKLYEILS